MKELCTSSPSLDGRKDTSIWTPVCSPASCHGSELGNVVQNRWIGGVTNGWEVSGIINYHIPANLPSIVNSNFNLSGSVTVPVGTVADVNGTNTSTCTTTSVTGTCSFGLSSTTVLGTLDVNLQPRIVGNPAAKSGSHQYLKAAAFSLPTPGTNAAYRHGFSPGPGFFDTDLTLATRFALTHGFSIQLRVAAFNFINHANNSFTSVNSNTYTMNFSPSTNQTSLDRALLSSTAGNANDFGFSLLKEGRRIVELGLRYDF